MPEQAEGMEPEAQSKTFDEGYVKELRNEAASYRVERNELKKQVEALTARQKELDDAGKSEVEKMAGKMAEYERKVADLERERVEDVVRAKVITEASKLNFANPLAAYKLVDRSLIDEDPASVKKALAVLLKEEPYLARQSQPPTPGVGGQPIKRKQSPDEQFAAMLKAGARK